MKLVKEYINFERGVDPKKAMQTGPIPELIKAMEEQNWSFWENDPNHQMDWAIRCQRYKFIPLIIGMGADFKKVALKYLGHDPTFGGNFAHENPAVRMEVKKKAEILHDLFELGFLTEKDLNELGFITESHEFKKGSEPKDSMQTGKKDEFPGWYLFHLLHQESKHSENFQHVSDIDYENKEPKFKIVSKFAYSKHLGTKEITYKEYTIYLTKDEGVLLFDDNNGDEKEILDLRMFNKITWCYDLEDSVDESNFERKIEPKDAMKTGIKVFYMDHMGINEKGLGVGFDETFIKKILNKMSQSKLDKNESCLIVNKHNKDKSTTSYSLNYLLNGPGEYDYIEYKDEVYFIPNKNK